MPFKKGQIANPLGRGAEDRKIKLLARHHTEKAVNTLAKMMDSKADQVRVAAACAILDRAYGKPQQTVDKTIVKTIVNDARLREAREKLRGLAQSPVSTVQ